MRLTTKRLILRDITEKDASDLVRNINNLNVTKWLLKVPYPYTMKDAKWYINHSKEKLKQKPRTEYGWAIELKSEKGVIGGCGISKIDLEQGTADIGYWIGEDYWRKGYVSEAARRMIDFGFNKLKLRRITIPAYSDNEGSNGLAKHLGFKYEGRLRKAAVCKATGEVHDENLWSLLRKEWKR